MKPGTLYRMIYGIEFETTLNPSTPNFDISNGVFWWPRGTEFMFLRRVACESFDLFIAEVLSCEEHPQLGFIRFTRSPINMFAGHELFQEYDPGIKTWKNPCAAP